MAERHFLVVGGTRGTGRALVQHLVGEEANCVSVLGRSSGADIQSSRLTHYMVDVLDREALLASLDMAVACYGKLSCAVFLQRHRGGKDELDLELAVAVGATKHAIEHLVSRHCFSDDGRSNSIVLVSSIADRYVAPEQ